ncbi:MAG: hypothetical protein FJW26_12380, partial [Acidimicrobiia bacterium]|nr:hypothetical protein [Acidimicrobiia bacterium]
MTQCKTRGTWPLLLIAGFVVLSSNLAAADRKTAGAKECRLIVNWDQMNMWALQLTYAHRGKTPEPGAVKTMLDQIVDDHAEAKIDRIVHCFFALPSGSVPHGLRSFSRAYYLGAMYENTESGMRHLEDAGYDFVQILLDRSRQKGMEFLGGLRMNDRHGDAGKTEFGKAHPEWVLT